MNEFADSVALDTLRYSMVWEDHRMVESGLALRADDTVLAIAGAGDNVLSMLLCGDGPREVVAVDASVAQIALCQLKAAAIEHLDAGELQSLFGFGSQPVMPLYRRLVGRLPAMVCDHWDRHASMLQRGVVFAGRLEQYFRRFCDDHLLPLTGEAAVEALLSAPTLEAQREVFAAAFDTPELERAFREYYGAGSMARRGRDPAQMKYVTEGDVGEHFWTRFRATCIGLHLQDNFYMQAFLAGRYRSLQAGPLWLRPENQLRLRERLHRVRWRCSTLEQELDPDQRSGDFSKAVLSDVFEYMSPDATAAFFARLAHAMQPGARVAYWNLLVPREAPREPIGQRRFRRLDALSDELHAADRAWFYRAFHVEEVTDER